MTPRPARGGVGVVAGGFVLALDPGIKTGWARSDWTCGVIDLSAEFGRGMGEALEEFGRALDHMLTGCRLLVIERPHGVSRFRAPIPDILWGRAQEAAWRADVRHQDMVVSSIRKLVCGRGNAKKAEVRPAVEAEGFAPSNPHEADACAVLLAAIRQAGGLGAPIARAA